MIAGSSSIFLCIGNKLCLWARTNKILISIWPRTRKFSQFLQVGLTHNGHPLVSLYSLCSDWSKFDRWVHAEITIYAASGNLFTDSWSWQSFVSSCDVLNLLFPLDVQNEIYCFQDSSVIHVWFVYWESDFRRHRVYLAWCVRGLKSWPYLMAFRSCSISTGRPV